MNETNNTADMTIEEAFSKLEVLLDKMEKNGSSLEESFADYKEGLSLIRFCSGKIDGIEKKIQILAGNEEQS